MDPEGLQSIVACANPAIAAVCAEAGIVAPKPVPVPRVVPRDIWWPDRTAGQWSCKARADCNDNIPGNCPEDPSKRFSFGGGTANDLGTARNIAKANATANLQCQPKHVSCKCTGPKDGLQNMTGDGQEPAFVSYSSICRTAPATSSSAIRTSARLLLFRRPNAAVAQRGADPRLIFDSLAEVSAMPAGFNTAIDHMKHWAACRRSSTA